MLVWDAAALELLHKLKTNNDSARFITCCFSNNNQYLAAGTTNGCLQVWNIKEFKFSLEVSTNPDNSLNSLIECHFDVQGNILCTFKSTARVYDYDMLVNLTKVQSLPSAIHPKLANMSIFLPDGTHAITCGGKTLCLWNVLSNKLVTSAQNVVRGYLFRLSADGNTLLTYGDRCFIEVWDVKTLTSTHTLLHQRQKNLPIGQDAPDESSPHDICHCAVSVKGIVVGGTGNGDLFVWYGERLEFVKELMLHESLVTYVEFSPNGEAFVSADSDGIVMMWQILSSKEKDFDVNMVPLTCHSDSVEQVVYSIQGRRIASCAMDNNVHLYNGPSGDLIKSLVGHSSGVMRGTFSSDGCLLLTGDERGELIIWDGFTGNMQRHIKPHLDKIILDLYFIGQDKFICTRDVHSSCILVNEVATGKEVSCLSFSTEISTMSASSLWKDSAYLLCGLKDNSVKFVQFMDAESINILG